MYEIEIIKKHLIDLLKNLRNLKKFTNLNELDLSNNLDLVWILERGIYLCIQNILDIFAHIVSSNLNLEWESYADIAKQLKKENIINDDEEKILILMSGYRNRLSHDYLGLDTTVLIDIVKNKLDDFYKFAKIIMNYCDIKEL
jgi:uncharacterized protein YutE (UPF0331/DUF86 family)